MRLAAKQTKPRGFTLIELSIVLLIIGLLMAFVLVASASALESARVRGTQAMIAKISAGMDERIEALLSVQAPVNGAHQALAAINPSSYARGSTQLPWGLQSDARAQVIARLDQMRAELPDVFFIDPSSRGGSTSFPVQFAGIPYPRPGKSTVANDYILPLGAAYVNDFIPDPTYDPTAGVAATNTGIGGGDGGLGTGINGASYFAAASLYKLIGYTTRGYDAVDNDGVNGVDDYNEGTTNPDGTTNVDAQNRVAAFMNAHQHKTARAEMLYALLIEGQGPLGSVFSREDFRDNEVRDTDNDGVPEFVDGWGEPLQFYRWPVFYRSSLQRGDAAYNDIVETRDVNTLDPNGQLTAISWWGTTDSVATPTNQAAYLQNVFLPLFDPNGGVGTSWDRSGSTLRRAYFTKYLILSAGPDREYGVPRLSDLQLMGNAQINGNAASNTVISQAIQGQFGGIDTKNGVANYVAGESWGVRVTEYPLSLPPWASFPVLDGSSDPGADDLSNHDLLTKSGGIQ